MQPWLKLAELPFDPDDYSARLLAWYDSQGRDLPWRHSRDPYRIWLSEIMLQQTTVAAVIDYYQRFLSNFSSVEQLAAAPLEAVIDLWAGLGYYSRARNLHAAAKMVVEDFDGVFPADPKELESLPGVGRSTAGAIAALAFDKRAAILDGNVRRVLCRLFAWQEPARTSRAEKQLWLWAEALTPELRVHDYTQAIMDFGATLCTPRRPQCDQCPVAMLCQARKLGIENDLPVKQPTKKTPTRREVVLLLEHSGRILSRRRLAEGFLGGLWEFPSLSLSEGENPEEKITILQQDFAVAGKAHYLGQIRHVYSHFRLESLIFHLQTDNCTVSEGDGSWLSQQELQGLALHGAHKKVLEILLNGE